MPHPIHPSQYERGSQAVLEPSDGTLNSLSHFACCDDTPGEVSPALCGTVEECVAEVVDEVDCIVCTWAVKAGRCPRHGKCPY